jgi:hypothetical protein
MIKIEINDEDIFNLKIARDKLINISEPGIDLEVFTIIGIIKEYEEQLKNDKNWNYNKK